METSASFEARSAPSSHPTPRNYLVLFQLASLPARLQKASKPEDSPNHRLKFHWIERLSSV
jgi:hypothetical protein